jgi:hypothetical protein
MLLPSALSPSPSPVRLVSPESVINVEPPSAVPSSAQPNARTSEQDKPKVKVVRDMRDIRSAEYQGFRVIVLLVPHTPEVRCSFNAAALVV